MVERRYVCFMDESATRGMSRCGWLCMAIICFARGSNYAEKAGLETYYGVLQILGWRRGELKWRKACRAARQRGLRCRELVNFIVRRAAYAETRSLHIESSVSVTRIQLAASLLREAAQSIGLISLVVLDQGLVPEHNAVLGKLRKNVSSTRLRRLVFRSSTKTPGIQLADILAGYKCRNPGPGCRKA